MEGQWSEAELPFHESSQVLGINNRAVYRATMQASFVRAHPLGINNRATLSRHLCPFIQPCLPALTESGVGERNTDYQMVALSTIYICDLHLEWLQS